MINAQEARKTSRNFFRTKAEKAIACDENIIEIIQGTNNSVKEAVDAGLNYAIYHIEKDRLTNFFKEVLQYYYGELGFNAYFYYPVQDPNEPVTYVATSGTDVLRICW